LRRVYLELKQNKEYTPENLVHPKYQILEKLLINELNHNPDSRILVFVKLRVSVSNITNKLKTNEIIRPVKFVGQTTKSKEDKGLSQKKQIEILDKFREGEYNVLVSTNVGEEGLDIAECDMVVFFDVVASEIRFIQRRGRTARHREGKVVILYTKETNDDIYLKIALNKLKKMNINLNSKGDLNYRYKVNERISNYETKPFNDINSGITNNNIIKNKNDHGYSKNKRKYQSSLKNFVNSEATKHSIKKIQIKFDIVLSNVLPMKLGLRRKLSNENFSFQTIESEQDIIIFKKVVINIYDPKEFSKEFKNKLISINTQLKNTYQLVINIFNFIDFRENIEGEFRLLKRKLQEFGKTNNLQIISIDNPEELIFIVKNIHEQNK
jgi:superfamily II DNA/RNA helicase